MKLPQTASTIRTLLISVLAVVGLSFSHVAALNASAMSNGMMGHKTNATQCQSVCIMAVSSEKQDEFTNVKDDDREPVIPSRYVVNISLFLLAVGFVVKIIWKLSSWRPPDLVRLYSRSILYA